MAPASEEGGGAALGVEDMSDDMQVCSCNNVDKGTIFRSVTEGGLTSVAEVKSCTKVSRFRPCLGFRITVNDRASYQSNIYDVHLLDVKIRLPRCHAVVKRLFFLRGNTTNR